MSAIQWERNLAAKASRRKFLKGAAALAMSAPAIACGQHNEASAKERHLAYVGTYSYREAPGSAGHGRGIYLFEMDPATGTLTERAVFPNAMNPSWLDLDPSRTHLYCIDEMSNFQGANTGAVSAYAIDRSNGHLTLLNTVSSGSSGPAYVSVHPSGKYALVANYGGGSVAVLPIRPNGELASATDVQHDHGIVGPKHPTGGPRGNFSISGHEGPNAFHAHMVLSDPSARYVLSTDLAMDKILVWKLDLETGKLTPNDPPSASLPPGDGPRHFAFHPNGRWLYCLQEEASTLVLFHYDGAKGTLEMQQSVSTLPKGFAGTNFCSEVRVSPDGKFVYAANRLHDSVAIFSIGQGGRVTYEGEEWTRGDTPRSITLDPAGNFLYSLNQLGDAITTYRINRETGRLTFTGQYTPVGTPACMVFLT